MHLQQSGGIECVWFGREDAPHMMLPPLSTVRTPRAAIGQAAAQMLLSLMRGEEPAAPVVDLGYELVVRGST